jgi:hypothetical protein
LSFTAPGSEKEGHRLQRRINLGRDHKLIVRGAVDAVESTAEERPSIDVQHLAGDIGGLFRG